LRLISFLQGEIILRYLSVSCRGNESVNVLPRPGHPAPPAAVRRQRPARKAVFVCVAGEEAWEYIQSPAVQASTQATASRFFDHLMFMMQPFSESWYIRNVTPVTPTERRH
jgi:hypothetical protein